MMNVRWRSQLLILRYRVREYMTEKMIMRVCVWGGGGVLHDCSSHRNRYSKKAARCRA